MLNPNDQLNVLANFLYQKVLGGGNSNIFGIFTPELGEDEPILTSIFFGWVGSTTNQFIYVYPDVCLCLLGIRRILGGPILASDVQVKKLGFGTTLW